MVSSSRHNRQPLKLLAAYFRVNVYASFGSDLLSKQVLLRNGTLAFYRAEILVRNKEKSAGISVIF
jgi:hypothetical protein